ncbi:MAG: undecaprenyl diphosphate synthase family protein [Candidatus Omnitrophica bacterium]|nr:undecaprenyl diphosphate synthase family protein [Candidatus Omnitrophota bacterium]
MTSKVSHIGLIPDGNRRWAVKNNLDIKTAYNKSMQHICDLIEHFFSKDISLVSIYLLSKENLSRGRFDLETVLDAEENLCRMLLKLCLKWECKVIHAGLDVLLPEHLANEIKILVNSTSNLNKHQLHLLVGYNPFDEVNSAFATKTREIKLEDLWVKVNLDMIIRTAGGNVLLSNFLPLQSGYAQVFIVNELFNDFSTNQFDELLEIANNTTMLLGK